MSRNWKIFLGSMAGVLIILSAYFYLSVFGLPFKKSSVAKNIQKHLEEKYEQDVELVGAVYNFKDKNYGGVYTIGEIEFYAEEGNDDQHEYIDTYPNAIWVEQLKEDFQESYQELFPRATALDAHFVHSLDPVVNGPEIPRYDEVDSMLSLDIEIDDPFKDEDKQWEAITKIAMEVQDKSPFIDSTFLFVEVDLDRETFIGCPDKDTSEITSVDDAKKHCSKSVFNIE